MASTKAFLIDNPEFRNFVSREFDITAIHATVEELAEFAFGSVKEAVKQYKNESAS